MAWLQCASAAGRPSRTGKQRNASKRVRDLISRFQLVIPQPKRPRKPAKPGVRRKGNKPPNDLERRPGSRPKIICEKCEIQIVCILTAGRKSPTKNQGYRTAPQRSPGSRRGELCFERSRPRLARRGWCIGRAMPVSRAGRRDFLFRCSEAACGCPARHDYDRPGSLRAYGPTFQRLRHPLIHIRNLEATDEMNMHLVSNFPTRNIGNAVDHEALKTRAFHDHAVVVMSLNDPCLSWVDREELKRIAAKKYGPAPAVSRAACAR